ncbi:MAG: maltose ABC transporter permease MalF [Bacteriovoracaceae bacterium]
MKILNSIGLTLFTILSVVFFATFLKLGHYFLSGLTFFVAAITILIFQNKKAYAYRFMYPGLITFLLFMILPIIFTIFIGFTNLSTGHYLSQNEVLSSLLEEVVIDESSPTMNYRILKQETGEYKILATQGDQKYSAILGTKGSFRKAVALGRDDPPHPKQNEANILSLGEVFELKKDLKEIHFILPNSDRFYRYFRTNRLSVFQNLYRLKGDNLVNTITKEVFTPNLNEGFYENDQRKLIPGFYVKVGFSNFAELFSNQKIRGPFVKVFLWTLAWAFFSVLLTFIVGMFLAVFMNSKTLKGKKFYRMLFIIPYSIPFFISVLIFKGMLNKDFGIINQGLEALGFATKVPWLETPLMTKISCLLVNLWLGFPYMFLVTTGILQSIPDSVYEAARLDGAGRFAILKKITLPLIMSAIGPLLVGSFAFNLNNFVGIYLLTGGGPPMPGATTPVGHTDILISYTYRLAFEGGQGQNFGLASSISILIFIIIAILTLINFKLSGMTEESSQS